MWKLHKLRMEAENGNDGVVLSAKGLADLKQQLMDDIIQKMNAQAAEGKMQANAAQHAAKRPRLRKDLQILLKASTKLNGRVRLSPTKREFQI